MVEMPARVSVPVSGDRAVGAAEVWMYRESECVCPDNSTSIPSLSVVSAGREIFPSVEREDGSGLSWSEAVNRMEPDVCVRGWNGSLQPVQHPMNRVAASW